MSDFETPPTRITPLSHASTSHFRPLPFFKNLPDSPPAPTVPRIPSPNIPNDSTACWQLVELYNNGDTANLTPKEYEYLQHFKRSHGECGDRYLTKYRMRRAKPTNLKERIFGGKWEQGWEKERIGQAVGVSHEAYYLVLLLSLKEAQETESVRLHAVKDLDDPTIENYRGPALVDLSKAADNYDLKYRSVLG